MRPIPVDSLDAASLRQQLAGKQGSGYWRSLAELAQTPDYELQQDEFINAAQPGQGAISRRNILKLLGASMALAGLTGCSRQPEEHIIPYVEMPEQLIPGRPRYYATAVTVGGYAHGVLAESHEGRPTKLEGNPDHPATLGACDPVAQASVLSLYDPDRSATVRHEGVISSFGSCLMALKERQAKWDKADGAGLCFLTGNIASPCAQQRMATLRQRWPQARWFVHEPVNRNAVFAGSQLLFGKPLEPRYRLAQAAVIVSLDADFLQAQPGFLRYAHDFSMARRPSSQEQPPSRLYVLESSLTVTGAAAEHRCALAWQDIETATRQLALALGLKVAAPQHPVLPERWVQAMAEDLRQHRGTVLIVPGEQQSPAVHAIAHKLNEELGGFGNTLEWMQPVVATTKAPDLIDLVHAIQAQEVQSLIMLDTNPVYTASVDLEFAQLLQKVPWSLHWGEYQDETAQLCHWHIPAAHYLEGWGDVCAYDGTISLVQPLIQPLHGGQTLLQMLVAIDQGVEHDSRELLLEYWRERYSGVDFPTFWKRSLRDGVVAGTRAPTVSAVVRADWAAHLTAPQAWPEDSLVLQFRPDPTIGDGRYANNGWLQELPRPLTTLTWHNAALISPTLAQRYGLEDGQKVALSSAGQTLDVPVFILPGHPDAAITLALGHGRTQGGRVAQGVGSNAYRLRASATPWAAPVTLQVTDGIQQLAAIQTHNNIEGRDLIRGASWEQYQNEPRFAQERAAELSLYPEPWPAAGTAEQAWGMSIDLSACIGCNACVTACQAENNIPVVGPEEIARGHNMHWLRVDRYFSGSPDAPGISFQPVPCMHCENAPCEYVCPVGATQHSVDGLNQMIYQRCVGTRYCSQNCPYKVRRFNWFDYTSAAASHPAQPAQQNPNVSVRTRGVMEKCTYCVQRISSVRQDAEAAGREISDGELKTACQQACPTQAIVFGDLADPASEVSRLKAHPLNYALLTHLNTRPRTTYLAAVTNPNPALLDDGEDRGDG